MNLYPTPARLHRAYGLRCKYLKTWRRRIQHARRRGFRHLKGWNSSDRCIREVAR